MTCNWDFAAIAGPHRGVGVEDRRPPDRILSILRHPIYAGAYAYGTPSGTKHPATGRTEGGKWFVPPEELPVSPPGSASRLYLLGSVTWRTRSGSNRIGHSGTLGVCRAGEALLQRLVVCGKCGRRHGDPYKDGEAPALLLRRVSASRAGRALRAYLGGDRWTTWSRGRCSGPWSPPRSTSACGPSRTSSRERKRFTTSGVRPSNVQQHEVARAERQYQAVEPENRLVARTLEARWEDALKRQRQVEEEYHRFLAKLASDSE